MLAQDYPILEFDHERAAMIEPTRRAPIPGLPERCVVCFFNDVLQALDEGEIVTTAVVHHLNSEIGKHPVYVMEHEDQPFTVFHPGVGAPLSATFLEAVIALGCNRFIACGGAGALNADLVLGHVVVPTSAVRDEGTSYHYLPASREVSPSAEAVAAIEATLTAHDVPYVAGKTWTTDGLFRETRAKVLQRREEGCLTVEMEAAAFFAVAQFRDVVFGQLLYSGDDLSGEEWDSREWDSQTSTREKLFWLAAETVFKL